MRRAAFVSELPSSSVIAGGFVAAFSSAVFFATGAAWLSDTQMSEVVVLKLSACFSKAALLFLAE